MISSTDHGRMVTEATNISRQRFLNSNQENGEKSFRRSARQKRDSKLKLMVPGSGALEVGEKQDTESAHGDSRTLSCRAPGSPADALDGFCS